ncbi:family 2B encapsulin nanocompartment shell protein [Longispora albida]|uniref:family 2B encapsulin nanocompartment shell protein n=1 Tax=Longispora albida TaxID=203523 RepID=UPI00037AC9C2|nr:family 2B encapsulin nanocompartment shell protein [Longispora albida]
MTQTVPETGHGRDNSDQHSLSTAAARNLATTTKSVPQMQEISPRWLLRALPWTAVSGGTYRVNRRLTYQAGEGRVAMYRSGGQVRVVPESLAELPLLRGFTDVELLTLLADRLVQREFGPGEVIAEAGTPVSQTYLIAHGKVTRLGVTEFGDTATLGTMADGGHFGEEYLVPGSTGQWGYTVKASTAVTLLALPVTVFAKLGRRGSALVAHIEANLSAPRPPQNRYGEAAIELASGHAGEPQIPATFVDYELEPREYEMSIAQAVVRVHTRVADLYNQPMNQTEQQLRLTVEALRERQEDELVNNRDFGLLHNADLRQCLPTRSGPPTPADLDDLLSLRRDTSFFFAHPQAIAAFHRECTRFGVYPETAIVEGEAVPAWRGVPMLPCTKVPISESRSTSIIAVRAGEAQQGVIGLRQAELPGEREPGLSVRFMGINEQAIMSYLVTAYFSVAVLVPDALGVLENVELGHYR